MNPLIELIISELRRVFVDRLIREFVGDMTQREFFFFIIGGISFLLVLGLRDMTPTVVFLHIDKTGGMSLREFLARQFEDDAILPVVHHAGATYQPACYPTVEMNLHKAHHFFEVMYEPDRHKLVMGHWDASILKDVPNAVMMTVLREPFARFVSLYRFICQEQWQFGDMSRNARRIGIQTFAERYQLLYANVMTMQLGGVRWTSPDEMYMPFVFDKAVKNLSRLDYVGTRRGLSSLMRQLSSDFGWSIEGYPQVNVTEYRDTDEVIPDGLAEYVREVCAYDVQLYETVCEMEGVA